jgi:chromosome segregation ATPase
MAASPNLPDFEELLVALERLERREREVSTLRGKLHERLDRFPNEVALRQERQLSAERRDLHRRIDLLRAEIAPLRRHVDPAPD